MTTVRADWLLFALCRTLDPDLWFSDDAHDQAQAKQTCEACPVREQCLDYTITAEGNAASSNRYGIAGGRTPSGRRWIYEQRMAEQGTPATAVKPRGPGRTLAPCGTEAAYRRHQRAGERPCRPCRQANALRLSRKKTAA